MEVILLIGSDLGLDEHTCIPILTFLNSLNVGESQVEPQVKFDLWPWMLQCGLSRH